MTNLYFHLRSMKSEIPGCSTTITTTAARNEIALWAIFFGSSFCDYSRDSLTFPYETQKQCKCKKVN